MKRRSDPNIVNRRARFDYELGEEFTFGLSLSGPEVRAARDGHVQLKGAFVSVRQNELWLNNASFSIRNNDPTARDTRSLDTSPRRLLAHRREIDRLIDAKKAGLSIVPLKLLRTKRYIKLVAALAKGKKRYDKRETLRRRDFERESARLTKRLS